MSEGADAAHQELQEVRVELAATEKSLAQAETELSTSLSNGEPEAFQKFKAVRFERLSAKVVALTATVAALQQRITKIAPSAGDASAGLVSSLNDTFEKLGPMVAEAIRGSMHPFLDKLSSFAERLDLGASSASSNKVLELLHRISLLHSEDRFIPCCTPKAQVPELGFRHTKYQWEKGEATESEIKKGIAWLKKHICPKGTTVLAVQSQTWLQAAWQDANACISGSKTDFLIVLDNDEVKALGDDPSPEQLRGIIPYVIGAYEAKTAAQLKLRGLLSVWPQVTLEALALNYMATRGHGQYFVPVFGGDFNHNLVLHAAPMADGHDFMLHAAKLSNADRKDILLSVRYMRYLLDRTKQDVEAMLTGASTSDVGIRQGASPGIFQLQARDRNPKQQSHAASEPGGPPEADMMADADEVMQAIEHGFSQSVVRMLREPRMYRELGLPGPPSSITHFSLEEWLGSLRLVQSEA